MTNPYQILVDTLGHDAATRARIALELAGFEICRQEGVIYLAPRLRPASLENIVEAQERK